MDAFWIILLVVVLSLLALWLSAPYLSGRSHSAGVSFEAQVARTSFQYVPGELIPAAWKAPELTLSVVVPAYNEEYRLPQMLDETFTYLEMRAAASPGFTYEVLVVDDGSQDSTYLAALSSRPGSMARNATANLPGVRGEIRVIQLASNRGKGYAVRIGMMAARGEYLLMADADGATRIGDLERLERALVGPRGDAGWRNHHEGGGVQIVFGSRHHLKDEALATRSALRNFLMLGFHFIVWTLVGGPIHDTQCGFKLFHHSVGKRIFATMHLERWSFDIEIVVLARMFGHRIAEVPVTWTEMPGSKLNLVVGALSMLRDIVAVQVLYFLGVWRPSAA